MRRAALKNYQLLDLKLVPDVLLNTRPGIASMAVTRQKYVTASFQGAALKDLAAR
jgi:hypothetical protein